MYSRMFYRYAHSGKTVTVWLLAILFAMLFDFTVSAQQVSVKGFVIDENDEPMIGCFVLNATSGTGVTVMDGKFTIAAKGIDKQTAQA